MSRMERTAREVFVSLLANKQRAMLMMLCVGVGVAVLSAVIAIGQGTRERVMDLVQVHNLDMIMVRAGGEVQVFAPGADRGLASLSESDARAIESEIPNVELLSGTQNAEQARHQRRVPGSRSQDTGLRRRTQLGRNPLSPARRR